MEALLDDRPLTKRAVDLNPDTAAVLGVQSVSPSTLRDLERVSSEPSPTQAPSVDAAPEDVQVEDSAVAEPQADAVVPATDAPGFDRLDTEPEPEPDAPVEPVLPNRLTHGKLFTDKRAHPLQIFDVLNMRYNEDWVEWEPETLWWALRRDFGSVGEVNRNKIMALRLAAVTDVPWLDWDAFENSTLAWNDIIPLFGTYQPVTPAQAAFGVHVLRTIRAEEAFAWEVKAYIAAGLEDDGFVYAPDDWYAGAQEVIDRKKWLAEFRDQISDAWQKIQDIDPLKIDWDESDPRQVHLIKLAVVKKYLFEREAIREKIPGAGRSQVAVSPPVPA